MSIIYRHINRRSNNSRIEYEYACYGYNNYKSENQYFRTYIFHN